MSGCKTAAAGAVMNSERRIHLLFAAYVAAVFSFIGLAVLLERAGLSRTMLGAICFLTSIAGYMLIGLYCRTTQLDQYFVAGRSIPAFYNGMACAADWISAATFISLAGGLYTQGFAGNAGKPGGFAYLLGWTGGFCLVALLAAPYLRRMRLYTLPEFFEQRYGGRWPRRLAMLTTVLCCFIYMVAQIYGVGLIASRLSGVRFEIGMLLGLSGVLVCSFLGGMRAVTWTQVAQYVILLLAFLIPVSLLSYKQTGSYLAPLAYARQLQQVTELEQRLRRSPQEQEVMRVYAQRAAEDADKLRNIPQAMQNERQRLLAQLQKIQASNAEATSLFAVSRSLEQLPRTESEARQLWQESYQTNRKRSEPLGSIVPTADAGSETVTTGQDGPDSALFRRNVLALMFCLFLGTLGLPHLLTRYFTTPSAAATRTSVAWTTFFVAALYICIPAMAVLVKYEVMNHLVGTRFDALPQWIGAWNRIDRHLLDVQDINHDGILQFAELQLHPDLIMLAMPEITGLPFVVSAMVATGGLAAALSTADGLLLTIGTTLAHDGYYREINPQASEIRRVMLSKLVLLIMALGAAYVAAHRPSDILNLVTVAFSLAASAFVPALVLGIFWRKATRAGAVAGMLAGLVVAAGYTLIYASALQQWLPTTQSIPLLWGIQPISSAVFGVPAGIVILVAVSLLTQPATQNQPVRT